MDSLRERFWELPLADLTRAEWEALCDGCGQCCLQRYVDGNMVTVYGVACELLDIDSARCKDYPNRLRKVPSCHRLTPTSVPKHYGWLPETCAYRRLYKGKPLPAWHPLLIGDRSKMRKKGITVSHYAIPSGSVSRRQMERHVIARWPVSRLQKRRATGAVTPKTRRP